MSNITNKRAYIHKANQERDSASDFDKKWRVVRIFRDFFGLNALGLVDEFYYFRHKFDNKVIIDRGNPVGPETNIKMLFQTYEINKMDLFIKARWPDIIIEIDGLEHGFFDEMTESDQTHDRDLNYKKGKYSEENKNYLKLTTEDLKENDDSLATLISSKLGIRRKI